MRQRARELLPGRAVDIEGDLQHLGDEVRHVLGIGEGGEFDHLNAIWPCWQQGVRDSLRKPALADAAGAHQRHQAPLLQRAGTFTLTLPDDTFVDGDQVPGENASIDTISFHTVGGELLFYKVTNNLALHYLWANTDGGMEETYMAEPDGYVTSWTQITIGKGVSPIGPSPVPEPVPAVFMIIGLATLTIRRAKAHSAH